MATELANLGSYGLTKIDWTIRDPVCMLAEVREHLPRGSWLSPFTMWVPGTTQVVRPGQHLYL